MTTIVGLVLAFGAGLLLVLLVFTGFVTYNSVVAMRQRIDKAWGNVEVALQQRHDELPRVVDAVRGMMDFEQDVLENVTRLRAEYSPARPIPEQAATSEATTQAVRQLFAVVEKYPQLRSAENVLSLQAEIERLETVIADRRELYNDAVFRFNSFIQQLPGALFAGSLGWAPRPFFDADPAAEATPDVSLGPTAGAN